MSAAASHAPDRELLLAMLGHELASAAQAVVLGATILVQDGASAPGSFERTTLVDAAQRVGALAQELVALLRHRASELATDIQRIDIVPFLETIVTTAGRWPGRRHRVRLECEVEEALVWTDPTRLRQILENLIDNAFKYGASHGQVIVRLRRAADESAADEPPWVLAVLDQGDGIDEDSAQDAFQPYRRLHASTGTPGSGLGLAICRYLARLMGGRLAYRRVGAWSEFFLELPSADDAEDPA